MSRPVDIPDDVWETAVASFDPATTPAALVMVPVLIALAIMAERERCARVAEDHHDDDGSGPDCQGCGEFIAAAIRTPSNQTTDGSTK